jgi:signal transduction histidine kinase/CheY-like chemotaxis protein
LVTEVANNSTENQWAVRSLNTLFQHVDIYVFKGQQLETYAHKGSDAIVKNKNLSLDVGYFLPFHFPTGESRFIVIRYETRFFAKMLISVLPISELTNSLVKQQVLILLTFGVLLGLIFYNLFLAYGIRDWVYVWYSLHASGYFLFFLCDFGWACSVFGLPKAYLPLCYILSSILVHFFGTLFCFKFPKLPLHNVIIRWILIIFLTFIILKLLLVPFTGVTNYFFYTRLTHLFFTFAMLIMIIWAIYKKIHQTYYVAIGWFLFTLFSMESILATLGVIENSFNVKLKVLAATAGEMFIFSLALADRVRQLRLDKLHADQANQAKSIFLSTISHEIRTPLLNILGLGQLLNQTQPNPIQQKYIQSITSSGNLLLTMLNDILDMAKSEFGKTSVEIINFNLTALLDNILELINALAEKKDLQLVCQIDPAIPAQLSGDATKLRQILLNLLGNAIKFTEQGQVSLSVTLLAKHHLRHRLEFCISDTGIGIPEAAKSSIFEPFFQSDSSIFRHFGGSGLGLSITKQFVEAMGGEIRFDSVEKTGSRFFVSLEFNQVELLAAVNESETETAAITGLRILVVDDLEINRDITAELLLIYHHQPVLAKDGYEALALLEQDVFDLVLMDVQMPELDGVEVTRQMRARHDLTPVIGLTATLLSNDLSFYLNAGMDAVVNKPFDNKMLNLVAAKISPVWNELEQEENCIEQNILQEHRNCLGEEKMTSFLKKFQQTSAEYMQEINQAWEVEDFEKIAKLAHQIAGIALTLGFLSLGKQAEALEKRASSQTKADLEQMMLVLNQAYQETIEAMQKTE